MALASVDHASIKGWASEQQVRRILSSLVREGVFHSFRQSSRWDLTDRAGIDFQIIYILSHGFRVEIPLQVKSSSFHLHQHRSRPGQTIFAVNGQSITLEKDIRAIVGLYHQELHKVSKPRRVTLIEDARQLRLFS